MVLSTKFEVARRNPDVLTCIANLSNDEVFTPPELAKKMLDNLEQVWAQANNGAVIWEDASVKFLDPCTKSGVFLREIVQRLSVGLEAQIPDLRKRVDHILKHQVFGIGITQLTSLLARRSVYCSKYANGPHSIASSFSDQSGNIWFEPTSHEWIGAKCKFCSVRKETFDRGPEHESYAYKFIHSIDLKSDLEKMFGESMIFDVVIGNPPYQMKDGAGGTSDSLIFHLFVEQAMQLEPRYLTMVIPSRWMSGGRGLEDFRREMLNSNKIQNLVDYPVSKEVFAGVEVKGGVSYFLWSPTYSGDCEVTVSRGGEAVTAIRQLGEFDVFVRDSRSVDILRKVRKVNERSITEILTPDTPFGISTNFSDYHTSPREGDVSLYYVKNGKRSVAFISKEQVEKNLHLIDKWKVLVPKAGSDGGQKIPDSVLGKPWIAPPGSVCTQTFMAFWAESEQDARNIESYFRSKFFRHLVSLRKLTQDALRSTYNWVPVQKWDEEWTDAKLYEKYRLSKSEIQHIESVIRPMELEND